jgi:hypothetical protein
MLIEPCEQCALQDRLARALIESDRLACTFFLMMLAAWNRLGHSVELPPEYEQLLNDPEWRDKTWIERIDAWELPPCA